MIAMRVLAAKLRNRRFTTAEASAILCLRQKQIDHLIDEIAPLGLATVGQRERLIEYKGLFALLLAQELTDSVKAELRAPTLKGVVFSNAKYIKIPDTTLLVIVKPHRDRVSNGLRALYEAESEVATSPEIMQGEPCIKGTRVPVYIIAGIAETSGVSEVIQTYPFLTEDQIKRAMFYARAHPRKGRPKTTAFPSKPLTSKKVVVSKRQLRRA